jgi:hypothetical protein
VPLKIDISAFLNDKYQRVYTLDRFNIIEKFVTPEEAARFATNNKLQRKLRPYYEIYKPYYSRSYIREKREYIFDENIFNLRPSEDIYLDGYFQNEKYFLDIKDIILKEFTLKAEANRFNEEISTKIRAVNSVCIHFRRLYGVAANGQWVGGRLERNATLSLNYYYGAIKRIVDLVKNPYFFVFADDLAWARDNLKIDPPKEFISHNGPKEDYEDLRLMSLCKHHIIANSTFSWWGAWLAQNPYQLVFAPAGWNPNILDSKHIITAAWQRL